jgi:hypothetical protein
MAPMRKLIVALSMSTVTLAATTAYFARELQRERSLKADVVPTAVAEKPANTPTPTPSADKGDARPAAPPAATSGEEELDPREAAKRRLALNAEQELAKLLDPAKRRTRLDEMKVSSRRHFPQLAQVLRLSDAEYDRLLELLAEQGIATHEMMLRCALDPGCKFPGIDSSYRDSQKLQVTALIGADRQLRLDKYLQSLNERNGVAQFRGRLPEKHYLSDAQSERLIAAIAEEHQRFEAEITQGGGGFSGYNTGGVSFVLSGEEAGVEKRLAEATEYVEKIRERAAQVLTAGQLAIYDEMLDEGFRDVQSHVREEGEKSADPPN